MAPWPGLGGFLYVGFWIGLVLAAILAAEAIWTSRKGKRSPPLEATERPAAAPWFRAVAGLLLAMVLGLLADGAFLLYTAIRSDLQSRQLQELSALPLRGAACAGDVKRVQALLREPMAKPDQAFLGQVVFECTSTTDVDSARDAVFAALVPQLHRLYLAGQHFPAGDAHHRDYCQLLESLVSGVKIDRLQQLAALGLPLHCGSGLGKPGMVLDPKAASAQLYALIGQPGGFLAQMSGAGGSYLDRALSHGRAMDIEAALRAGIDPHRIPSSGMAPVLAWALRKHVECEGCRIAPTPIDRVLTAQEVAQVDRLMPAPSAAEIDRCDPAQSPYPALMKLGEFARHVDGGSAYLAAMLRQGADIGIAACWAHDLPRPGIFHAYRTDAIAPAMLATLRALDDAQFKRLAHPVDRVSGQAGVPLLASAGDGPLRDLLCERLPAECAAQTAHSPSRAKP